MVGYLALLVDGVADLLEIASTRANKVNGPALANVVRPTVECAGSVRWLLDEEITAEVRVRRYLIWRFDDLRQQRRLLSGLRHVDPSKLHAAHSELASSERDLLAKVESAGWRARPSQSTGAQYKSAALLTDTGTAESMPPFTKLVDDLTIPKGMYQLLSVTTHNHRWGVRAGLRDNAPAADGRNVQLYGFALPPSLLVDLTVLAAAHVGSLLGNWNGFDTTKLRVFAANLSRRVTGR